jgi:hypothetical protein
VTEAGDFSPAGPIVWPVLGELILFFFHGVLVDGLSGRLILTVD